MTILPPKASHLCAIMNIQSSMIHEAFKMRVFDSNFSFTKYSKIRFFGSRPCGLPPYGVMLDLAQDHSQQPKTHAR